MQKIVSIILALFFLQITYGQKVKTPIKTVPTKPTVKPISTSPLNSQEVILYADANYLGAFKTLTPGQYVLSDFNDVTSSIKVPPGMVAYIFEHAAPDKGYGISVDYLEDVPDLSAYNFNDKASYIIVFNATRDNYVWIRNANVNGQFIPGHWERKKATPLPPNPIAVVSPAIASPLPTTPSVLEVNGANTTITSLGVQTNEGKFLWEKATKKQLGVIGNDYRGIDAIGSACFERASNNVAIPDHINFWYPQKQKNDHRDTVYFKRTLVGTITKAGQFINPGTFEDYDANIDIKPDPSYEYLITDAHKPEYTNLMKTQRYASFGYSGESGCPDKFDELEAEIADRNKPPQGYESKLVEFSKKRIGKKICVYGTWIYDKGHCCHPEIHPAEQSWWMEASGNGRTFNMNVICDDSGRYLWRSQMDDGTKLKPWAEPPIKGVFAIAFEYNIPKFNETISYSTNKFEVANIEDYNVIKYPNADQTYNLVYEGKNIVSFIPHNDAFKVSFEHVGISAEDRNKIKGFLVIETSVGKLIQIATEATFPGTNTKQKLPQGSNPSQAAEILEPFFFRKESGFYYFTVTESRVTTGQPVINGLGGK